MPFRAVTVISACSLSILASGGQAYKYCGLVGLVFIAIFYSLFFSLLFTGRIRLWLNKLPIRFVEITILGLIVITTLLTLYIYPIANSGSLGGGGSDNDDALVLGANALIDSTYPYYQTTYLGGRLAILPSSIILSIPFVAINHIELQNVFWLIAFIFSLFLLCNHRSFAIQMTLVFLVSGGVIMLQQFVTGADRFANGIYVCIATTLVVYSFKNNSLLSKKFLFSCFVLGLVLASRINMLVILPPLLIWIASKGLIRNSIFGGVCVFVGFTLSVLPFFLYEPGNFAPFTILMQKTEKYANLDIYTKNIFLVCTALTLIILSLIPLKYKNANPFSLTAVVISVPFIAMTLMASLNIQSFHYEFLDYISLAIPTLIMSLVWDDKNQPISEKL